MITEAAIKTVEGKIYTGMRHCYIISENINVSMKLGIQGFVDESGKFYTRQEAAVHAFECKQITNPKYYLISEDLW